jgi:hypothetical protein
MKKRGSSRSNGSSGLSSLNGLNKIIKNMGAIGFDRDARSKEACRGLPTRKQAELNTTADSHEYALAA